MNSLGDSADGTQGLNENSLPVELQSKNILNPAYAISTATNGLASSKIMHAKQEQPYIVLHEQPQQRGFRFRYECEGPSHGGLQGVKTERSRKSFPSIKIENYTGAARIVVSLVTDEKSPRPHAHKLVGSNCANGSCTIDVKSCLDVISFPNLCVLHVTRKKLVDVLTERIMDSIRLSKKLKNNNMNIEPEITDDDRRLAKTQASDQAKSMQLNVVRLCFQVFLKNPEGAMCSMLTPVVSHPIYDSKSPGASALKICRMDKYGGCCSGNEEVFLLCEKVQKDDIQVRFVEQNGDGSVKWEALGNFGPLDVHRQYAIVFKTPPYWNSNIDKPVNVLIMLQRKSDLEVSEPKAFTYFPQNRDKDNIASKKRKRIPLDGYDFGGGDGGGLGGAGLGGDGGSGGGGGRGGGMGGPGGGGRENIIYVLNRNEEIVTQQRPLVPGPVEEAIREGSFVLESERLAQIVSQQALANNSDDPWITLDSDIEVDGLSITPSRKIESGKENFSEEKLTWEKTKDSADKKPSRISFKDNMNGDKKSEQKKSPQETSPEWLDSGVDPDTPKSISSFDEKRVFKLGPKESDQISLCTRSTETAESEEKVDDNQRPGKTNLSDTHSEPDAKTDVVSVGVKSDEGFSETSDETGVKGQQISKSKMEKILEPSVPGTCGSSHSHCSDLTNTVRQVTERVAERTVAALSDYAETGDIRHLLLVQRHLMAVSNANGDLPLHLAVINNQPEALKNLLDVMSTLNETKRHINAINMLRQTPLHLATVMQSQAMVETLLHSGADTTISDRNGNTAAHLAVMNNSTNCLKSLVKYLRPGASKLDPFPELNYLNYDGYSPVHLAAQCGSVSMLEILVYGQADVDLPDGKSGKTALHHAVDNDDLSVADYLLLQAHTDLNARCFDGNTALHIACARQLVGMVALLVSAGADTQCENEEIPDQDISQEDGTVMDRRGLQPRDYAEDNEQILRILSGRAPQCMESGPPSRSSLASEEENIKEDLTGKMSSVTLEQKSLGSLGYESMGCKSSRDSGLESIMTSGGIQDLNAISIRTRIEISRLLDPDQPGKDVLALTKKMGYQSLLENLEGAKAAGTSPTTFLLEYLENVDGNLASLRDGLRSIERMDVLSLISPAI